MTATVDLTHPKIPGSLYTCTPAQAEALRSRGWVPAEQTTSDAPAEAPVAESATTSTPRASRRAAQTPEES